MLPYGPRVNGSRCADIHNKKRRCRDDCTRGPPKADFRAPFTWPTSADRCEESAQTRAPGRLLGNFGCNRDQVRPACAGKQLPGDFRVTVFLRCGRLLREHPSREPDVTLNFGLVWGGWSGNAATFLTQVGGRFPIGPQFAPPATATQMLTGLDFRRGPPTQMLTGESSSPMRCRCQGKADMSNWP